MTFEGLFNTEFFTVLNLDMGRWNGPGNAPAGCGRRRGGLITTYIIDVSYDSNRAQYLVGPIVDNS